EGVHVNGDGVRAVFKIVALFVSFERKLALLPDRNEARAQAKRNRRGKDEPAGVSAHDSGHRSRLVIRHQQIHAAAEKARVGEDRRDVFELDTGLRKIGYGANGALQIGGSHFGLAHNVASRRNRDYLFTASIFSIILRSLASAMF